MKKKGEIQYLLLLISFVLHTMLPFFAVYNPAHVAYIPDNPSQSKKQILICTAAGLKWVAIADIKDGVDIPMPAQQYQCPLCYLAAHGIKDALPAQNIVFVLQTKAKSILSHTTAASTPKSLAYYNLHTRAPPLTT